MKFSYLEVAREAGTPRYVKVGTDRRAFLLKCSVAK